MEEIKAIDNLLFNTHHLDKDSFLECLHEFYSSRVILSSDTIKSVLIDKEFMEEIKNLPEDISVLFGKTPRDLKCVITDGIREHDIFIKYKSPKKLCITSVDLPHSPLQDRDYSTIKDVATAFQNFTRSLSGYFFQLNSIDEQFNVKEPLKPTFKDTYRRIELDRRTWLHIEVTPNGLATNIHLVGQSGHWQNKLQSGLQAWDHDQDIVNNIKSLIIGEYNFESLPTLKIEIIPEVDPEALTQKLTMEETSCVICFCIELPGEPGVPQPICQNTNCGVYYHRNCLYQWLIDCKGGCPSDFGVVSGSCPSCLQPITCNKADS